MWGAIGSFVQLVFLVLSSWTKYKLERDEAKKKLQKELSDEATAVLKSNDRDARDKLLSRLHR